MYWNCYTGDRRQSEKSFQLGKMFSRRESFGAERLLEEWVKDVLLRTYPGYGHG
jgi:hypothetical protein